MMKHVTQNVTMWLRPRTVEIVDGYLIGSPGGLDYPLTEAVGAAFDMISECRTEDDALRFTERWGFLYEDEVLGGIEGQLPRFLVGLFFQWRNELLAIAGLAQSLRENRRLDETIDHFWQHVKARDRFLGEPVPEWAWPEDAVKGLYRKPLYWLLKPKEKRAFRRKIGPIAQVHSLRSFVERSVPESLDGYAAYLLAAIFQKLPPSKLVPVERNGRWELEEAGGISSLDQLLLWDLRQRLDVIKHQICEACGKDFIPGRSHQRFCSTNCSARWRMQRKRARDRQRELHRRPLDNSDLQSGS